MKVVARLNEVQEEVITVRRTDIHTHAETLSVEAFSASYSIC